MNYANLISNAANKNVVMLALQSHGAEEDYKFTADFVTELVANHGFRNIFFLSSWYDSHIANSVPEKSNSLSETADKFLYKSYAKSSRFNEMWDKIQSASDIDKPLKISGIDIPMGGSASTSNMLSEIESFISEESKPERINDSWSNFIYIANQALKLNNTSMTKTKHKDFNLCLGYLKEISKKKGKYFSILIDNLHARFLTTNDKHWRRQKQIFNNFEHATSSLNNNEKIIIIGHAAHLVPINRNFGEYVKLKYKEKSLSALFTASRGSYLDSENGLVRNLAPNKNDSFEHIIFSNSNKIDFFDREKIINLLKKNNRHSLSIKISNYISSCSITELMVNNKHIDVAIIFENVTPVAHQ